MEVNTDRLTNSIQTLPVEDVVEEHNLDRSGQFPGSRIISTISPVVVRQDDPGGPSYQEAPGYTFLINSPKYPGLVAMDDGKLVLTLSGALHPPAVAAGRDVGRTQLILFSEDDGMSWTQPRRIGGYRTTPMNLGGPHLALRGWLSTHDSSDAFCLWFSDDCGRTFSDPELVPPLPDGRRGNTDVAPNFLIEGDTIRFMFYTKGLEGWRSVTFMRPYDFKTHAWGEPFFFPYHWRSSEASLTRAANGDLVASFRSSRPGIPEPNDHWRAIITSWSADDGKTWAEPAVHFLYGYVHHSFLNLPDGRILMTYAARIGELEGRTYHGIEAVMSHDFGRTWDWEHRYILFRGTDGCMHSPQSVLLSDGRILTVLMHGTSYSWNDGTVEGNLILLSHVNVVIWSAG